MVRFLRPGQVYANAQVHLLSRDPGYESKVQIISGILLGGILTLNEKGLVWMYRTGEILYSLSVDKNIFLTFLFYHIHLK